MALYQQAGGIVVPLLTAVIAFLIGGLVIGFTGAGFFSIETVWDTYRAIFEGAGLNWFFPWVSGEERRIAEFNLQQTLVLMTPLILTGLAVAFAFRCGLFNIGGQGQYIAGSIMAVWVGSEFADMPSGLHIMFAIGVAILAGAFWAGIAGFLKATFGSHEVITTIMLNWIMFWIGTSLFGLGGPLQNDYPAEQAVPKSNDVVEGARLTSIWVWGNPLLQGLHIGIFIAIASLFVYWIILNRTTLGYEVRTVGYNPEAARYAGISVPRNYFLAMAISGAFAGLAGALDVLGWEFRLAVNDVQISTIGFIGIAVALLGRNSAVGVFFSALLFGALISGTSTRNLDPEIFDPTLADNLTLLVQGLIVLFVGADVLILYLWSARKKLTRRRPVPA
jgi:general nucleoside transport system permease protein